MLTGTNVARIRKQRGWSQQYLALKSNVNKPYISEYEAGIRPQLPPEMLKRITEVLLGEPAGRTSPRIVPDKGRFRLVLRDKDGNDYRLKSSSVQWTEDDGTTYTMFLGEVGPG